MAFINRQDQEADCQESPQGSYPEMPAESAFDGQTISSPRTALDSGQYQGRDNCGQEIANFFDHARPQAAMTEISSPSQLHGYALKNEERNDVKGQTPPGPKAVRTPKQSLSIRRSTGCSECGMVRVRSVTGLVFRVVHCKFRTKASDMVKHSA